MTSEEAAASTLTEVTAYIEGWEQRFIEQKTLLAMYCAIPTYQTQCKKPPKIEDLVPELAQKKHRDEFGDMTLEELRAFASDDELRQTGD